MIELVDMCSLQDPAHVDFRKMKDSGVRGVYLKSSQYSASLDPTFHIGVERATAAGLACGAYHFAYCGSDPVDQMVFFWNACRFLGSQPGELPPLIDWEYADKDKNGVPLTKLATVQWLVKALKSAKQFWYPESDRMPSAYTFPDFANHHQPELSEATELAEYPLTLAYYPAILSVPQPWEKATVHQYAGNDGRVPGVSVACDRDRFLGTEDEFQRYLGNVTGKVVPDEETTGSGGIIHTYPESGVV